MVWYIWQEKTDEASLSPETVCLMQYPAFKVTDRYNIQSRLSNVFFWSPNGDSCQPVTKQKAVLFLILNSFVSFKGTFLLKFVVISLIATKSYYRTDVHFLVQAITS